jgi:hypothetical protein
VQTLGKTEVEAVAKAPFKVPLSSAGRRAMGKRSKSAKLPRGKHDCCFNELGSSMPFRAKSVNNANIFRTTACQLIPAWSTTSTIVETDNAFYFSVSNIPQISSFTALFDQYRVTLLEVWVYPQIPTVPTTAGSSAGTFYSCVDLDDVSTVTGTQMLDYENVVISHGIDGHYHRWKPSVAIGAYAGGFSAFVNEVSPWVDMAGTSVQHYGLKTAFSITSQAYAFDLICRAHVEFRCVR